MSNKTKGELIVEMLCDGVPKKTIKEELNLTEHYFKERLNVVRREARLPYDTRTYKARKDDVLSNVEKWNAHKVKLEEMKNTYLASLVEFDF